MVADTEATSVQFFPICETGSDIESGILPTPPFALRILPTDIAGEKIKILLSEFPRKKLEVSMPPVRLAAEGAEQIAEVAQSGTVSRLAHQAVDLLLARERAPIQTIGQVKR